MYLAKHLNFVLDEQLLPSFHPLSMMHLYEVSCGIPAIHFLATFVFVCCINKKKVCLCSLQVSHSTSCSNIAVRGVEGVLLLVIVVLAVVIVNKLIERDHFPLLRAGSSIVQQFS